jgi:hypothetical protein
VITADSALHVRLTTRAELQNVLVDCAGWPGARRAMHVVRFAEPKTESPTESVGRVLCLEQGLPPPRQVVLNDVLDVARVDFYWPEHVTVLDIDGMVKYDGRGPDALKTSP